jgi:ribosomal protein S18 acetylase RimI-like enzyme
MPNKKSSDNLKVAIVQASKEDLSQILDLEYQIFKSYCIFSRSRLRYLLSSPNASLFLCYHNKRAVGFGIALKNKLRNGRLKGRIYSLGIIPEYQFRGAGASLLRAMEKSLINSGVSYIVLETIRGKESAAPFFMKHGYAESESLQGYYTSGDALRMKKVVVKNGGHSERSP